MAQRTRNRQQEFSFPTWGGRRHRAGRKPTWARPGVAHAPRAVLTGAHPVHVTVRVRSDVWNMRTRRAFRVIGSALAAGADRHGMRMTHFSVQGNHLHLVVEAQDARALSRGMQGLSIRVARGLNRLMDRKGKVLADRLHAQVLRTPREVRNAVAYVLENARIHARRTGRSVASKTADPYAAGPSNPGAGGRNAKPITVPPRNWLLRVSIACATMARESASVFGPHSALAES